MIMFKPRSRLRRETVIEGGRPTVHCLFGPIIAMGWRICRYISMVGAEPAR